MNYLSKLYLINQILAIQVINRKNVKPLIKTKAYSCSGSSSGIVVVSTWKLTAL